MVFIPVYLHRDLLVGPNLPLPCLQQAPGGEGVEGLPGGLRVKPWGHRSGGQEASLTTKSSSCTFRVPLTLLAKGRIC